MKDFNLKGYSLVLIEEGKIIFKSKKEGLKPLVECINKFKSKTKGGILYDKVIGLAAAKLIVYSKMISEVITPVCSKPAFDLLKKEDIKLKTGKIVDNILGKDKKNICPMEIKAKTLDGKSFFLGIKRKFKLQI